MENAVGKFYFKVVSACMFLSFLFLHSCEFIRIKEEEKKPAPPVLIARVHDTYLYSNELEGIAANSVSEEDSIARIQAYIKRWTKNQLFINEALQQIDVDKLKIEKKVLDYRNSLIGYQFRKLYLQQHLVDTISKNDIEAYYNAYQGNFVLQREIIKGTYIKVPQGTQGISTLKPLIFATDVKNKTHLRSYCISFSVAYHLDEFKWIEFDRLVVDSPLASIQDKVLFLQKHLYYQTEDADFLYFLKIDDYKIPGDISPLEFVEAEIKNIIISKRKVELAQQQEKEIYENAVENEDFEFYIK